MTGSPSGSEARFVAVDVQYLDDDGARAAMVVASDRRFSLVTRVQTALVAAGAPYQPGLGAHVHAEFGVPVIGVAKKAFLPATHAARVFRGQSLRPLYVTATGMTIADAAGLVADMAGRFRMPDALKRADRLARGLELPPAVATAIH
jgi:deoxyribonuclease V